MMKKEKKDKSVFTENDFYKKKDDAFKQIVNEFKGPLTVIKGVTEYLKLSTANRYSYEINILEHNVYDLQRMITQIQDLSRLSTYNLEKDLKQTDLISQLRYFVNCFQLQALQQGITIDINTCCSEIMMDLDTDKLRSVIHILITNVLTQIDKGSHCRIDVALNESNTVASIEIKYTGNDLGEIKLNKVTELYFKTAPDKLIKDKGHNIGLYYLKKLMSIMGGGIKIKNDKKHTTILLELQVSQNAELFQEDRLITDMVGDWQMDLNNFEKDNRPQILVIEDDPYVSKLLQIQLNAYDIILSNNGNDGIRKGLKYLPDLIICDIMMPGKDGYEVCRILKSDERTNHIPIILLTAKDDMASEIKGLEVDADAYIKKPFEQKILNSTIKNLINNRIHLQKVYQHLDKISQPTGQLQKDELIFRFREVILKNISDENLNLDDIADILNISRSGIYAKIKALTGLSTSNYINKIKMQKAKAIIETENKNISEIAYMVGITNLPYFSTLFRREYGISPNDYKRQIHP